MALVQFPTSPTLNQTYTVGSKTWKWNGYAWDILLTTTPNTAFNIYGGSANQIHYQTSANITSFITAPSNGTFLYYTTAGGFSWSAATSASVGTANIASYEVVTNATTGTYYPSLYGATSGNLAAYANSALSFNAATGALTATSFSGSGSGLTGVGSSFTAGSANNISGGSANAIHYQTGAGVTNFITAPSTNNTFLNYTTGSGFTWQSAITSAGGTFSGSVTITGDLSVSGNTTFTGNTNYINVTNMRVSDPVIYLAANNYSSDLVSIGFVGNYFNGANQLHTGLFRAPTTNNYYLFTGVRDELDNVNSISTSANGWMLATLNANISGPLITATGQFSGPGTGLTGYSSTFTSGTANNVIGGAANKIVYQTNTNTTGFIDVPSSGAFLSWNGSAFIWTTASAGSIAGANVASYVSTTATTTNASYYPSLYATSVTGNSASFVSSTLSLNPSTGALSATSFSGAGTGLTGTASSLTAGLSTDVAGGTANQILYQTGTNVTDYITAPTVASTFLSWNGSAFVWSAANSSTITSANISSYEAVTSTSSASTFYPAIYPAVSGNLAISASSFLSYVPSTGTLTANTFSGAHSGSGASLTGVGSSFTAGYANNVAGGTANQIHYQTATNVTGFVTAPSVANTFLSWNGSTFTWQTANSSIITSANVANYEVVTTTTTGSYYPALYSALSGNLGVYANNALTFNAATGSLGATIFSASGQFTGPGTGLTGTASSLTAGLATNIAGGSANVIPYQTGTGTTSFTPAASNGTFLYYSTVGGFSWQLANASSVGTANVATYETVTNATSGTYYAAFYPATSGSLSAYSNNALSLNATTRTLTLTPSSNGVTTGFYVNGGDITSARTSTTGYYYFGSSSTSYLNFDGTNYNFGGTGGLFVNGAQVLTSSSTLGTANIANYEVITNATTGTYYPGLYAATSGSLAAFANSAINYNLTTNRLTVPNINVSSLPSNTVSASVGSLQVGSVTSFNDINTLATYGLNVNNYAQTVLQNLSSGTNASADYIVNCDVNATSIYGDFGINSSTFAGGGAFGDANGTFLYAAGGTLSIGTLNANVLKLATNNTTFLTSYANTGTVLNTSAIGYLKVQPTAAPTVDMMQITNAGFPITTAGTSAIQIDYYGGAAAIESSASRVNMSAGNTSGGIWNAFRIAPNWAAQSGVVQNGIKFDTIAVANTGTDNMIMANTGWDNILAYNNGTTLIPLINGTGQINASQILTGTVPTASLGSGSATSSTYLRGDSTWATVISGTSVALVNDTTSATTLYPLLSAATSGTLSSANTSNTKLSYVPSTGTLTANTFSGAFSGNGASISSMNASNISTGTIGTARLGSGTANANTYLVGNSTWATLGVAVRQTFTATAGQTSFTVSGGYAAGLIDVYRNGSKLVNGTDVTVTSGTAVVLTVGASSGDTIDVVGSTSSYSILSTINAGNLTGTIPSGVLGASSLYIGNTAVPLNATVGSVSSLDVLISANNISGGTIPTTVGWASLPAGTIMTFQQTTAPTGWTKITTYDDYALRVVAGTAGTGGTVGFSAAFSATNSVDSTTLLTTQIPAHSHPINDPGHTHGTGGGAPGGGRTEAAFTGTYINDPGHSHVVNTTNNTTPGAVSGFRTSAPIGTTTTNGAFTGISIGDPSHVHNILTATTSISTGNSGGGLGHNHTTSGFAVKYVDMILASKN